MPSSPDTLKVPLDRLDSNAWSTASESRVLYLIELAWSSRFLQPEWNFFYHLSLSLPPSLPLSLYIYTQGDWKGGIERGGGGGGGNGIGHPSSNHMLNTLSLEKVWTHLFFLQVCRTQNALLFYSGCLAWSETQPALSSIWTRLTGSISQGDNRYDIQTSNNHKNWF